MNCTILLMVVVLFLYARISSAMPNTTHRIVPLLQPLTSPAGIVPVDTLTLHTSDSARIILPSSRISLAGSTCIVEIVPLCRVDSVIIFVRHSRNTIDTIAHFSDPPFSTRWNYASLSDQDPIHLQFGYILFHCNGKKIISLPTPHRWAIDRSRQKIMKTYTARKIVPPDTIIIDGKLDDWKNVQHEAVGNAGTFACKWSRDHLYFAIHSYTSDFSPTNFIELHLDPLHTSSTFPDERHRSLHFSPPCNLMLITAQTNYDSTVTFSDSIAVLLNEGMNWRILPDSTGYTLEASLPYYALASLAFPKLISGFDISFNHGSDSATCFTSWSGSGESNRYNPSEWGTISFHQSMVPLKIILFYLIVSLVLLIIIVIIRSLRARSSGLNISLQAAEALATSFLAIESALDNVLFDVNLTITQFSLLCGRTQDDIVDTIKKHNGSDFNYFLKLRRIKKSKQLLKNDLLTIATIAEQCGFSSVGELQDSFLTITKISPDMYRNQLRDNVKDEEHSSSPPCNFSDRTGRTYEH